MNDTRLKYFLNEYSQLLSKGNSFSKEFPKVAGNLTEKMHPSEDPHMDRVIEAMTELAGEIKQYLMDGSDDLGGRLSSTVASALTDPFPSSTVVQFDHLQEADVAETSKKIPSGELLFSCADGVEECVYTTTYPVDMVPVRVAEIAVESPMDYEFLLSNSEVNSLLKVRFEVEEGCSFPASDSIRLYLNGDPMLVSRLYEIFFSDSLACYAMVDNKKKAVPLGDDLFQTVGFDEDQYLISCDHTTHPGLRALVEYFCFPQKYHFVDLKGLSILKAKSSVEIIVPLVEKPGIAPKPENVLTRCTPVVNLYENWLTLPLDERLAEYPVQPHVLSPHFAEIRNILSVNTTHRDCRSSVNPMFEQRYPYQEKPDASFWNSRRSKSTDKKRTGSDTFLSFRDKEQESLSPYNEDAVIHAVCTNRNLASLMPGGTRMVLKNKELRGSFDARALFKPTLQLNPVVEGPGVKVLTSLMNNAAVFYGDGDQPLDSLKQVLKICNLTRNRAVDRQIEGIVELLSTDQVARVEPGDAWRGWVRGKGIEITFDQNFFVGSSCYLFGAILNRFFTSTCSINSFARFSVKRIIDEGAWKVWLPELVGDREIEFPLG